MANLTPEQITAAKAWLHDIFVAGGLYQTPRRALPMAEYRGMYGTNRVS